MNKIDIEDVLAITGLIFVAVGLWMFHPWVALTVVGVLLIAASVLKAL